MPKQRLEEIIEYANWLVKSQEDRVKLQKELRGVYLLKWDFPHAKEKGNEWVVPVVDPLPNNAVRTMANILANREPRVSVKIPREVIEQTAFDRSSALAVAVWRRLPEPIRRLASPKQPIEKMQEVYENVIRYTLRQNDERRDGALRRDAAIDGFVYDQMAFKCVDLRLTRMWRAQPDPSLTLPLARGGKERTDGQSPFVIKRIDPTALYVERDDLGVNCAIHRYVRPLREVKAIYRGRIRGDVDGLKDEKQYVLFCEKWWRDSDPSTNSGQAPATGSGQARYWKAAWIEKAQATYDDIDDQIQKCAWIVDDTGAEIQENTLGFIPIISKTCNGSGNEIMPTLYAAVQSGVHIASNIAWTYRASLPIKFANPQWQLEGWVDGQPVPKLDYTAMRVIPVRQGQRLAPLDEPHNSEIAVLAQAMEHKMQESLISETMLGRYPTGAPASAFALATSTGAQIIEPVREALNRAFSEIAQMEFKYLKRYGDYTESGEEAKLTLWIADRRSLRDPAIPSGMDGGQTVVDPSQIPEWMDIDVEFEPDLPQDKIALMNIAMQAYAMRWLPRDKTYEIARLDDINEIKAMWDEEQKNADNANQPQRAQGTQSLVNPLANAEGMNPLAQRVNIGGGLPSSVLPPNIAQGYPIEQNPSALLRTSPQPTEAQGQRLNGRKNAGKGAR